MAAELHSINTLLQCFWNQGVRLGGGTSPALFHIAGGSLHYRSGHVPLNTQRPVQTSPGLVVSLHSGIEALLCP